MSHFRVLVSAIAAVIIIVIIYFLMAPDPDLPDFSPVQPDTFADNSALSNSWGDFDNDGDLDLVVSFETGDIRLYQNVQGTFINVAPEFGLLSGGREVRSVAWGDYNADGYLDLYVGGNQNGNELYRNDRGTGFTEVGLELGVDIPHVSSRQISWVDFDNNGSLDLFVADRVGANYLFRNDGGVFVDISEESGLADARPTVGACWFDYNQDGLLDLFLTNQSGTADALYRNDGGKFTDVAATLGLQGLERSTDQGGVDCTVGDYDNDGDFDLFVATYGVNYLYRYDGLGGFVEVSEKMGISGEDRMVGASWADYDNDGYLDLYVAGYEGPYDDRHPLDRLFHNEGSGFHEIDTSRSPLSGADHGIQWADFDQDGDLDMSLTEGYNSAGHHPVLRNELAPSRAMASLQIQVLDQNGLPSRAGAEVRLFDGTGNVLGTRLVPTGDGYNSQSNQPVHFGLTNAEPVTVEVTFLTDTGRKTQTVEAVNPEDYIGKLLRIKQE